MLMPEKRLALIRLFKLITFVVSWILYGMDRKFQSGGNGLKIRFYAVILETDA